jgi:uncharacterized protein YgiM (DUF1202 family)
MKKNHQTKQGLLVFSLVIIVVLIMSSCASAPTPTAAPTQDVALIQTQSAQTVVADLTQTVPTATQVPPPTAAPTETPMPPGPTPDPSIPVAVIPTPAPGEPAAIANYNTVIFSGPGTNYVVYAALLGGKTAKVVGKSEDGLWWAISVPVAPTGAGWVSAGWVTVSGVDGVPVLPTPPIPPTTELVPPGPSDPQVVVLANAYVRTGPAINYPAYGIAQAGATGRVIGKSEDGLWWVVRLDPEKVGAGYGWIEGAYTQASNVENVQTIANPTGYQTAPPPPPPTGTSGPTATAIDYVNVRSGPGTNYDILVVAPPNSTGVVTGKSSDGLWWQVKISTTYSPDGLGWVSADWVITQNTSSVPVVAAPPAPPTPPPSEATPPPTSEAPTAVPPPATGTPSCALVSQDPADGTVFSPATSFNTTWVLQNTGTGNWEAGEVDIRYIAAQNNILLHQGSDMYDLTSTVAPGQTYNFTVPMISPFDPGSYGELWQVAWGGSLLCEFYVYITVP